MQIKVSGGSLLTQKHSFKVTHVGKPSITDLPKSEQKVFFSTLLDRILDLQRLQTKEEIAHADSERKSLFWR